MNTSTKKEMVTYEQARSEILARCQTLPSQTVQLEDSLRRVLAEPIKATIDLPLFNNSAVDGYGVLVQDILEASEKNPVKLKLVGEIAAGYHQSLPEIAPGQCLRILTGAQTPATAEAVVMKEYCTVISAPGPNSPENGGQQPQLSEPVAQHAGQNAGHNAGYNKSHDSSHYEADTYILVGRNARIGENIRLQGEEIEAGSTVLAAGTAITPPVLGLIASLGKSSFAVQRLPAVAVVSTGDELKEPGQQLATGEIYNSNSYALQAALNALGVHQVHRHHCPDNREKTTAVLQAALQDNDIIITAGGVSVGEYDYVKDVLEGLGVTTVFWKIAIKPGKPVYFGVFGNKPVFGLPGNPVSALVTFNLFVKPALFKMLGINSEPLKTYQARLARNLKKKAGRLDFVRGKLDTLEGQLSAMPVTGQESHMLSGLAQANCLLHFEQDLEFLPEGENITVNLLNWYE
jgi:molybdopterin molybdotransferase